MTLETNDQREILLVRAVYNFDDVQEGEIKLATGDVISVSKQVDENWWCGINLSHTEVPIGNFPKSFVKEITLPILKAGDRLVLSTSSFETNVSGDLNFGANEVIVLEHFIDENWCFGKIGNACGIFPLSFTKTIISEVGSKDKVINNRSKLHSKEPRKSIAVGLAVVDFEAQVENEISFKDGDTIDILEICDSSFVIGLNQSNPNKIGRLPLEFVYITEGEQNLPTNDRNSFSKFDWWKNPEAEKNLIAKLQVDNEVVPSFEEQTAPLETLDVYDDDYENSYDELNDGVMLTYGVEDLKQSGNIYQNYQIDSSVEVLPLLSNEIKSSISENIVDSNINEKLVNAVVQMEVLPQKCQHDTSSIVECSDVLKSDKNNGDVRSNALTSESNDYIEVCNHDMEFNCGKEVKVDDEWKNEQSLQTSSSSLLKTIDDNVYSKDNEVENNEELQIQNDDAENGNNNNNYQSNNESSDNEDDNNDKSINYLDIISFSLSDESSVSSKIKNSCSEQSIEFHCRTPLENNLTSVPPLFSDQTATNKPILKPKPILKLTKPRPFPRLKNNLQNINESVNLHKAGTQFSEKCNSQQNISSPYKTPSNQPKLQLESHDPKISKGIENSIFNSGQSSSKMKSVFYVNTFLENKNVNNKDCQSPTNHKICIDLSSGPVVRFHKIAEESEVQLDCIMQSSHDIPANTLTGNSIKEVPRRPIQPKCFENLSGAGALMAGPLDPDHLISSPSSSPLKNTTKSPQQITTSFSSENIIRPKHVTIPSRPPKPARTFASGHGKKNNFFSISSDDDDDDDDYQGYIDDDIIKDIERRITETEQDLEKCIMEQSTILNEKYENNDMGLSDEATDNLKFYQANILGLTDELTRLRAILLEVKQEDFIATTITPHPSIASLPPPPPRINEKIVRRKREELRKKAINELIQTELDFLQSMSTCYDVFFDKNLSAECPPSVDLDFLLGNMNEVIDLSQKFYNVLEAATNGKDFHEQTIGSCFEEIGEDLKRIHGNYCRNHDDVINALTKLELNSEAQNYFHKRLDKMRSKMMVFDLSAVLIKPVQRIMKYPLLIAELIKNTEGDHADYKYLKVADAIMKEVALDINEYKRRKDLVFKYKKPCESGFSKKFSKLTVHSIRKKLNRFMTPAQSRDETFQYEENKFKDMNIIIRNLIRDLGHYLDFLQVSLMDLESFCMDVSDHCRDENLFRQDLLKMEEAYSMINNRVCNQFKDRVENDIMPVLGSLLVVYQGPREVIRKRHHKLLDFNNALNRLAGVPGGEQTKTMKDELELLRRTYEAMNCQLLEDLPKLYKLSSSIVRDSIQLLALYQVEFVIQVKKELHDLLELDIFKSSSSPLNICEVMNEFTLLHLTSVDRLSELSFIPRSFNPSKMEDKNGNRKLSLQPLTSGRMNNNNSLLKCQSDEERLKVRNLFQPDKLYVVVKDFDGDQILDLCLTFGTLVGVIKEEDPMNNKERFFVCDGAQKGFILKSHLMPFEDKFDNERHDQMNDNLMNVNYTDDVIVNCGDNNRAIADINTYDDDRRIMNASNNTYDNAVNNNIDNYQYRKNGDDSSSDDDNAI